MFNFQEMLFRLPIIFMAITIHEYAHGYAAFKMGDPTAKMQGRLSMNPLAHMDLIGALAMLLLGFGWAKPVPINPNNFRDRKKGTVIVSLAGPLSNIFLAILGAVIYGLLLRFNINIGNVSEIFAVALMGIFGQMMVLNVSFAVFNLIPFPPLDGSKILGAILPWKYQYKIMQYERYAFPVLIILMASGALGSILSFFTTPIINSMIKIAYLVGGLWTL